MSKISLIHKKYKEKFGNPELMVRSPGRINLIGEHTDYNDGFVMPAAIDKEIFFAVGKNNKRLLRLYSLDFDDYLEISIDNLQKNYKSWSNYLIGVAAIFKRNKADIAGIDCVFGGNIPVGAGLSSSAALENGFAMAINQLYDVDLDKHTLINIAQKAEHEFAGVMCGIMDQFASMFGRKNSAVMLDCRSLDFDYIDAQFDSFDLMLIDTKVKHSLAASQYNVRRNECRKAVNILKKFDNNILSLRDVNLEMLNKYKQHLPPVIYKRTYYVISELERVKEAAKLLKNNLFHKFGELLYQTHEGLSQDYEVSCNELDFLVDLAKKNNVQGARMMGGGFGGCTINLIDRDMKNSFIDTVRKQYKNRFGIVPEFYEVNIVDGTSLI